MTWLTSHWQTSERNGVINSRELVLPLVSIHNVSLPWRLCTASLTTHPVHGIVCLAHIVYDGRFIICTFWVFSLCSNVWSITRLYCLIFMFLFSCIKHTECFPNVGLTSWETGYLIYSYTIMSSYISHICPDSTFSCLWNKIKSGTEHYSCPAATSW